jgi:hypothetical protein
MKKNFVIILFSVVTNFTKLNITVCYFLYAKENNFGQLSKNC